MRGPGGPSLTVGSPMCSNSSRAALVALLSLAFTPLAAAQSTWLVAVGAPPPGNGSAASPYTSIQYAITRPTTLSGDTLLVYPGTYAENVVFGGKSIVLKSVAGPGSTVIDGHDADTCVQMVNG